MVYFVPVSAMSQNNKAGKIVVHNPIMPKVGPSYPAKNADNNPVVIRTKTIAKSVKTIAKGPRKILAIRPTQDNSD